MAYAEFDTPGGMSVLVDQRSDDVGYEDAVSGSKSGIRSQASMNRAITGAIDSVASSFLEAVRGLRVPPDDLSVEFGIRLHYRAGAVLSMDTEGSHFKVTLRWASATEPRADYDGPRDLP